MPRLSLIVLLLILRMRSPIIRQSCKRAANRSLEAIIQPPAKILDLALGFLLLALVALALARGFKVSTADDATDELLGRACGLRK